MKGLGHGSKTRRLGGELVIVGTKSRRIEQALLIRTYHSYGAGAESFEMYGGHRNRERLSVRDRSHDDGIVTLSPSTRYKTYDQQNGEHSHAAIP